MHCPRDTAVMPETDAGADTAAFFRAHLGRIERGDLVEAVADYAEDAVLDVDPGGEQGHPDTGTFHGRAAIRGWLDNWFTSFEPGSYRLKVEESIENGERIFLTLHHTGRGEASGVDVTLRVYHALTLCDGLIVRHAFSSDREAVLRAARVESR